MASWPNKNNYTTGGILTATQMNEIGNAINPLGYTAGKNKIINGDFRINQRNFTSTTTTGTVGFDLWRLINNGGTVTYSAQTFTLGSAPVAGYEAVNYARLLTSGQSAASDRTILVQRIESARTLAGQIVTISFWAKAASGTPKIGVEIAQDFGTGGSPSAFVSNNFGSVTINTTWTRYSITSSLPSISGKTLGTNNNDFLGVNLWTSAGTDYTIRSQGIGIQNNTIDIWGVQLEAFGTLGEVSYSVTPQPTPFQTATGTIQGELAACQRYYQRQNAAGAYTQYGSLGTAVTTGIVQWLIPFPVTMRTSPSSLEYSNLAAYSGASGVIATPSSVAMAQASPDAVQINFNKSASFTQDRPYEILSNNTTSSYIGWSAEL